MFDRRRMLKSAGGMALGFSGLAIAGSPLKAFAAETVTLPFANG